MKLHPAEIRRARTSTVVDRGASRRREIACRRDILMDGRLAERVKTAVICGALQSNWPPFA
jgi:hypothetical protein